MKPISRIGHDDVNSPLDIDFKKFSPRIVQLFNHQPRPGRMLAPRVEPLEFDGTVEVETVTMNRIGRPGYAMEPENMNRNVTGQSVTVKTPQIFYSINMSNDRWRRTFAGKERIPIILNQMLEEIKNEEDLITWRGDANTGTNGLISAANGTDMGAPAGFFGADAGGDGILENLQAAIDEGINAYLAAGLPQGPIDVVWTSPIQVLATAAVIPYQPGVTNYDIVKKKLNGGNIYVTNNLQANVSATANTLAMIMRTGEGDAAWEILSSGLQQKTKEVSLWNTELGLREKFTVKTFRTEFIQWMDGINVNAS